MKIGKTVFAVLLTVFCLSIMIITAIPTRSSVGDYDPTLDINHDGQIDMKDLGTVARAFNLSSTGNDPTVPVNVTNWPQTYSVQTGTLNITLSNVTNSAARIFCGGFSRFSILLFPRDANIGTSNNITIYLGQIGWYDSAFDCTSNDFLSSSEFNVTILGSYWYLRPISSYMTETKAPYCFLYFNSQGINLPANWYVTIDYAVYLRNE